MVPNGWTIKKLEELASVERGKFSARPRNDPKYYGGEIPFVQTGDIAAAKTYLHSYSQTLNEDGLAVSRLFPKNTILITIAANIGDTAITTFDVACPDSLVAIQTCSDTSDSRWLISYLETCKEELDSKATQNAQKNINLQVLKPLEILTPPLPEQRKIATILGTWYKAISTTERLIDNSKQQKKALMQQLLTGKKRLLDDSGKPFEGEWEEITLEKLAKYRRGSFPQPYGNPEWVDEVNGYPFIQVYDIDKNMKLKPDTKIKISDAAIGKSVFIPKETVIVSLQGSIGRVAITQYDAYVDRTVLLFQEFIVPMDKVFFAFIIQELFEIEKTKAPGGTIKTITKEVLSNFKVHIPSITEQQKIASILINADQEIELLEQQLADFKQEKKALMQQLLTGKRRVIVDERMSHNVKR